MSAEDSIDDRSVTEWLEEVKAGHEGEPQQQLMKRFLHRLEALARTRLGNRTLDNEQDVALSAMNSFLIRAPQESYSRLTDRGSLWSLLAAITINKAMSALRRELAKKRDPGNAVSLEHALELEASPAMVSSMIDEGTRLLDSLGDDDLRQIACMRMEGY